MLLHNDPVNTMEYVVTTLQQVVPQLSEQDALAVMMEAPQHRRRSCDRL